MVLAAGGTSKPEHVEELLARAETLRPTGGARSDRQ
jgi:hypothetical protein